MEAVAFRSSHFALAFAMGVGAYIGVLHLWMWRRRDGGAPHLWVALFCLGSFGFQAARYLQLGTTISDVALTCGRFQVAMAPLLVFSLVGLARSLGERRWSPKVFACFGLANAILAFVTARTPLFIPRVEGFSKDWFGDPYLAAPGSPSLTLLLPYIAASFAYIAREVTTSPELDREERRALLLSLGAYAVFGFLSVLSALQTVSFPPMTQYGPFVLAMGLSYMLLHRHQRQRMQLEQTAEDHALALGESRARYRILVDSAPVGIVACRGDGQLVAINRRMFEILGAPEGAELSESGRIRMLSDDALAPTVLGTEIAEALLRCISNGDSLTEEISCTSHWGARLQLRLNVASVHDPEGVVTGAQAIVEDISDRRKLEDQLRHWQKMEAVGHLAAGIAHEINNPMAYVRTNLRMLKEEWSGLVESGTKHMPGGPPPELEARADECEELIDESLQGVDRTIAIVRDVKEFAHSGEARMLPIDLVEIVESSVRMATTRLPHEIQVERSYAELAPVPGSGGQLRQVFLNLLVNAIQAVEDHGHILVSVAEDGDEVVVGVRDDGCGISADVLEHLFDPFFTTKEAGEGTGLGLYISYEIVRAHRGDIRVQSVPGEGSLFEVRLPKVAPQGDSPPQPSMLRG